MLPRTVSLGRAMFDSAVMPVTVSDDVTTHSELLVDDVCEAAVASSHHVSVSQVQQLVKQLAEAETARDTLEARLAASSSGAAEVPAEALTPAHGDGDGAWSVQRVSTWLQLNPGCPVSISINRRNQHMQHFTEIRLKPRLHVERVAFH